MFEVLRTKNDNKTVIDNLGIMTEDELIDFASEYIGDELSQYGTIFSSVEEILREIEWIKDGNDDIWFEYEDTNLVVSYMSE